MGIAAGAMIACFYLWELKVATSEEHLMYRGGQTIPTKGRAAAGQPSNITPDCTH